MSLGRLLVLMVCWIFLTGSSSAGEIKTRVEIVKAAKPATALIDLKPHYGSAFCVHPSGLFITNEHVVRTAGPSTGVTLVLDAGMKSQKVLKGKVLRTSKEMDLALVQAEDADKLPSLALGMDDNLDELAEIIAFGFPFGIALAKDGKYPSISVNVGSITSLRRAGTDGDLHRIQLDAVLNPGNSGGPVLDKSGKVVGVVVSGIQGAGINMAIPVSHVKKFAAKPDIVFTPPDMAGELRHKKHEFRATLVTLLPDSKEHELDLILSVDGGPERRLPMKRMNGVYVVTAIPVPLSDGPEKVRVTVKYEDGAVTGMTADRDLRIGTGIVKLSEVRTLRLGKRASAKLGDGRTIYGTLTDFDALALKVGKKPLTMSLADALEVATDAPNFAGGVDCAIVASLDGKEVARTDAPGVGGEQSMELIAIGKFNKPSRSNKPVSFVKAVSSKGDYIGQGKAYDFTGDQMKFRRTDRGIILDVDGWTAAFGAPPGNFLAVGEYLNAKRHAFSGQNPGIEWTGYSRGASQIGGAFVVWELEMNGNQVVRVAIDFYQRCEGTMPPLYGMIRFNSNFR